MDYSANVIEILKAKKVGRKVRAGKSCATVESGKWVGPAKSMAGGEVVAVNEDLMSNPSAANADPYSAWLVELAPGDRLLRGMMTATDSADTDAGWHLWRNQVGIFIRSDASFDTLWGHLRRWPRWPKTAKK